MTTHECHFCGKDAEVDGGVAYFRAKLDSGKWGNVKICVPCWKEKRAEMERNS